MIINLVDRMTAATKTNATHIIQSAIDEAGEAGGGQIIFAPGDYICGPLNLRSNVHLLLNEGANILGHWTTSTEPARALICATDAQNIQISGEGLIDARGSEEAFPRGTKNRPHGFSIRNCRGVTVTGIHFRNSPSWGLVFTQCEDVLVDHVTMNSHNNYNNDGIDIVDCRNVRIEHCDISADDDGICLKSFTDVGNHDIEIAHCRIASHCNAIKTGTESYGAFRRIHIRDCEVVGTRADWVYFGKPAGQSAICLTNVDGADMEDIQVSRIAIRSGTDIPFCLKLGARLRPYGDGVSRSVGTFRNVVLEDIRSRNTLNSQYACTVAGVETNGSIHYLENIVLRNIALHFVGDVHGEAGSVEEHAQDYPHPYILGHLPSYGLYCRHVKGLRMENVAITRLSSDRRPPILHENVHGLEASAVEVA